MKYFVDEEIGEQRQKVTCSTSDPDFSNLDQIQMQFFLIAEQAFKCLNQPTFRMQKNKYRGEKSLLLRNLKTSQRDKIKT